MVAALLATGDVPTDVTEVVLKASDGLPFLVEEVVASLLEAGALEGDDSGRLHVRGRLEPAVPPSFAALVADRLVSLREPAAVEVLKAAAVLGEQFDWSLLRATCECDDAHVLGALREAAAVQLVVEDHQARIFRFTLMCRASGDKAAEQQLCVHDNCRPRLLVTPKCLSRPLGRFA